MTLIVNLLRNNQFIKAAYEAYMPEEGSVWRDTYPAIFCNGLCLAAMIELSDDNVELIIKEIMTCYAAGELPKHDVYQQLNSFLSSKKKQIKTGVLKELITFFIPLDDHYLQQRFGILTTELDRRGQSIKLSAKQRKRILDYSFLSQERRNFNTAIYFHAIAAPDFKKEIEDRISALLKEKFDAYLYYYAAISDVLSFTESEFLPAFINASYPDPDKYSFRRSFYGPEENAYPMFDMLFNICFKIGLSPKQLSERQFTRFGDYYDWLLDIEAFDYSKFKVGWLILYSTRFYMNEFKKHRVIKKIIEDHLRKNRDLRLERLYFDLYVTEDPGFEDAYLD